MSESSIAQSSEENTSLDLTKTGHQLRWLARQGATFALPYGRSKKDFPTGWTEDPKTLEEAIQHARSGGNVGLLTGKHSGGIVAVDRDVDYPATVAMLGNMAETAKIQRDNAPDRGKLLYRVSGTVPKSKVWKIRPEDEHPACELLANGRHALIPPSQFGGGNYVLIDAEMGIKEVTPEELDAIWFLITGEYLDGAKPTQQEQKHTGEQEDARTYVARVKAAWPTIDVFRHWKKDTAGEDDERGETRLLGNGGLLVNDWKWYCHADGVGGDQVDAWHWCETDKALDRRDKKAFWSTINSMAAAAGIAQPAASRGGYDGFAASADMPSGMEFSESADGKLPLIDINQQLSALMSRTIAVIAAHGKRSGPLLYVRNGRLVRLATDENGALRTDLVTPDALLGIMARVARWVKISEGKDGEPQITGAKPPAVLARVLCADTSWDLPVLEGLAHAPIFGADGTLHTAQGYNEVTRLYHAAGVQLGDTTPTPNNLAAAVSLLKDDLFVDFPLDPASKAHAIALLLLPFVRPMIRGATPLHLATAPQHRAGKSLLVESALYPALGRAPDMTSDAGDEAEWAKVLTSKLLSAPSVVVLDNLSAELRSPMLATAISEARVTSRILGGNTEVSAAARWVWAATGKNTTLHEELMLRSVLIRLTPQTERPEERTGFKHPHQIEWVSANRDHIVTAAITIVRNWIENANRKPFTGRAKGRFEAWVNTMGGILAAAGIAGFLDNEKELRSTSAPEADAFRAFVMAWWETHGSTPVTVSEHLFKLASTPDDEKLTPGADILGEVLGNAKEHGRKVALGRLLKQYAGRVYEETPRQSGETPRSFQVKMHPDPAQNKAKQWFLEEISAESHSDSAPAHSSNPELRGVSRSLPQLPQFPGKGTDTGTGAQESVETRKIAQSDETPRDSADSAQQGLTAAQAAYLEEADGGAAAGL